MTTEQIMARDLAATNLDKAAKLIAEANKLMYEAKAWDSSLHPGKLHDAYADVMILRNKLTQPVTA